MSESVDCNERWPTPETASTWSREILAELKWSIGTFDEPMAWRSSDGLTAIEAEPTQFSDEHEEPVPYGKLRDMPVFRLAKTMNTWLLRRTTIQPDEATILQERFLLHAAGRAIGVSVVAPLTVFEQSTQGEFARNTFDDEMSRALQDPQHVTIRDYANLFNAMHDLRPAAAKKSDEYYEYLKNMTKEDMRNHRAMQRDWVIQPELDKKAAPKWWGITNVNQAWLVKASSPEGAVLDLEDHFDRRLDPLFMVYADPYDDAIQEQLESRYTDGAIRELIPYSIVEWPNDANNMTDEQRAAFDRLRPTDD